MQQSHPVCYADTPLEAGNFSHIISIANISANPENPIIGDIGVQTKRNSHHNGANLVKIVFPGFGEANKNGKGETK
jgi:hypothetical protein